MISQKDIRGLRCVGFAVVFDGLFMRRWHTHREMDSNAYYG